MLDSCFLLHCSRFVSVEQARCYAGYLCAFLCVFFFFQLVLPVLLACFVCVPLSVCLSVCLYVCMSVCVCVCVCPLIRWCMYLISMLTPNHILFILIAVPQLTTFAYSSCWRIAVSIVFTWVKPVKCFSWLTVRRLVVCFMINLIRKATEVFNTLSSKSSHFCDVQLVK